MTTDEIDAIWDVTKGIPLTVRIAAAIYLDNENVANITKSVQGKRDIVDQMVRRYLLHVRDNEQDRAKIYALALLRRPDQPESVSAALGLTPDQAKSDFTFTNELSRLHRRYSFIFTEKEEPALHQEVRHFLRLWLLLLPFMLAAAIYRREANEEADDIGTFFAETIVLPYCKWWLWASESLTYTTSSGPSIEELHGLEELEKLLSQQRSIFTPPLAPYRNELEAALWWRLGEAYQGKDGHKALAWYDKALSRLNAESELKEAAAETCYDIAYQLYEEKKYSECLALLTKAIELQSDYALAYNNRGSAYYDLKQYESALADYTAAISYDPNYAIAYYNRGIAYLRLRDTTKAKDDFRRSHEIEPTDIDVSLISEWADMGKKRIDREVVTRLEQIANINPEEYTAYICRGVALGLRGKLKQGLDELAQAIPLRPKGWDAYFWQGMLRAYYYREPSHDKETMDSFRKALEVGLPPILLTPLYWLERDNPAFFARCAKPLLEEYDV